LTTPILRLIAFAVILLEQFSFQSTETYIEKDITSRATSRSTKSIFHDHARPNMDASHARPGKDHPEDRLANGHPPAGKPAPENQDIPQIAVDPPSDPPAVSRESTTILMIELTTA
jgi:hypothetical protein